MLGEEPSAELAEAVRDRERARQQAEDDRRRPELGRIQRQEREHDADPDLADETDGGEQPQRRIDGADDALQA